MGYGFGVDWEEDILGSYKGDQAEVPIGSLGTGQ